MLIDWKDSEHELWRKGVVEIIGTIDEKMYQKMFDVFSFLESIGSPDIKIKIQSKGGMNYYGYNICSLIDDYKGKVVGVAMQDCSSMAFLILQKCDKRKAFGGATMIPHLTENRNFFSRFTSETHEKILHSDKKIMKIVKKKLKMLRKIDKEFVVFLKKTSGLSKKEAMKLLKKDKPLSAKKALRYGLIDEIIPYF